MKNKFFAVALLFVSIGLLAANNLSEVINAESRQLGSDDKIVTDTVINPDRINAKQSLVGFSDDAYKLVKTFINPVLSGDHPDQTLLRVGSDFYATGSSFHFTPYVPIYHSTDLVHWEIVSRVVMPTWSGVTKDTPSNGIWQGALAQFGGYFWVYFSVNSTQYFSKAASLTGTWSTPVKVTGSTVTGYDNSIFVDDNGTPYMLMKNGQYVNRFQQIDINTGQLTGSLINCDFINANGQYSWAEGPVMCKRDGWYYYFIAGNVGGGQYVLRTQAITDVQSSWTSMGNFFATQTDATASFRAPNHVTQPIKLDDGSWWALSHSYESVGANDWSGKGRQGLLHQVTWDASGKPTGTAPTSAPQLMPALSNSGIPWNLPRSDYFDKSTLGLVWHFLNRAAATKYSLSEKPGWMVLNPGSGTSHLLQKEGGYYYSLVTKVDFNATASGQEAGLYLTNGNESVTASVYSSYNNGKKIGFRFNGTTVEVENTIGSVLWLKVERQEHQLSGFYSADGTNWTQIGTAVSSVDLDKGQANYNSWVGTSNGLYANNQKAAFDMFIYQDAFSAIPIAGRSNYFGLESKTTSTTSAMTNSTSKGGWLMLGGVDLGQSGRAALGIEIEAASAVGGTLEIWIDDLEGAGTKIATLNINTTGSESNWNKFSTSFTQLTGQHDVFLRWSGAANAFLVRNVRFLLDGNFLPGNNNCEVKAINCTCQGSNDGAINISFVQSLNYTIVVTGNNYSSTGNASSTYSLEGLVAGTYNVNITSTSLVGYQLNFNVSITQPEALSVQKVKEVNNTAIYSLSGGENYYVSVNDEMTVTKSNSLEINLQKGKNRIVISTEKTCQGTFVETIFVDDKGQFVLFPNPSNGNITLGVPDKNGLVTVEITSLSGNMLYKQQLEVKDDRLIHIDATSFASGVYTVKVYSTTINGMVKMLKK